MAARKIGEVILEVKGLGKRFASARYRGHWIDQVIPVCAPFDATTVVVDALSSSFPPDTTIPITLTGEELSRV